MKSHIRSCLTYSLVGTLLWSSKLGGGSPQPTQSPFHWSSLKALGDRSLPEVASSENSLFTVRYYWIPPGLFPREEAPVSLTLIVHSRNAESGALEDGETVLKTLDNEGKLKVSRRQLRSAELDSLISLLDAEEIFSLPYQKRDSQGRPVSRMDSDIVFLERLSDGDYHLILRSTLDRGPTERVTKALEKLLERE
jgi:hypothetical protein